jgi:hypothetical protein
VSSRRENAGNRVDKNLMCCGDIVCVGPISGTWDSVINQDHVLISLAIILQQRGLGIFLDCWNDGDNSRQNGRGCGEEANLFAV